MAEEQNEYIALASRPQGTPEMENFSFNKAELSSPEDGQLLVKTLYVSVDPYMRGRMKDAKSYAAPFQIGEPITGGSVGKVLSSKHPDYKEGDIIAGGWGWQRYAIIDGNGQRKVDPELAPITTALGVLGMTGLTAYYGTLRIGNPQPGETMVVSGAGGAVGMIAGQIGKIKGARVVGISGSDEKNRYLKEELGFDEVINYKTDQPIREALQKACPDGIDVYFENVGGDITDAVIEQLNRNARIPLCGQISLYNQENPEMGPRILPALLTRTVLLKGFLVGDYADENVQALQELGQWVREGKLKYKENIVEGFDRIPEAFLGLFTGENLGKQLVKVAEE
ncbi:NADP-dependent oxidoreductase [Paenibacillus wulumuqiensis]|uniref:NADP-dependent oxidoreductase n=1 Tax=Paenibacillus wulumuqiensis TaxID=1567107 RepID=UPI00061956AC|nr:NADP-dependent oxidoreductase [Paenibacillus wulumuqiensis]